MWIIHFRRTNPAATRRGFDANVPMLTSARGASRGWYDEAAAPVFFHAAMV
jgi:hypothetical protein